MHKKESEETDPGSTGAVTESRCSITKNELIEALEQPKVYRVRHRLIPSIIRVKAVATAELSGHKCGLLRISDCGGKIDRAIELAAA
jgi:hypothetical protein